MKQFDLYYFATLMVRERRSQINWVMHISRLVDSSGFWLCLRSSSSASTSAEALPRKPPGGRRIIAAAALRGQFPADATDGQKFGHGARHAPHQVGSGHGPRTTASHSSRSHRPAHFPAAAGRLHHRGRTPGRSVGRGLSFDEILTKKQRKLNSVAAKLVKSAS